MRVIAGSAGSIPLDYPKDFSGRPTMDAMRESLFGSLTGRIAGRRFADLYAGGGSVGIEALSRGAESCLFIEKDRRHVQLIEGNLEKTRLADHATVLHGRVEQVWDGVCERHGPFNVVFAGPPYGMRRFHEFAAVLVRKWEGVAPGGLVVIQWSTRSETLQLPHYSRQKQFGDSLFIFYERPER